MIFRHIAAQHYHEREAQLRFRVALSRRFLKQLHSSHIVRRKIHAIGQQGARRKLGVACPFEAARLNQMRAGTLSFATPSPVN